MLALQRTPELLLALLIFQSLDEPQRIIVRRRCEMLKGTGLSARSAAVAIQVRTIGDSVNLDTACNLIREHDDDLIS
ncbi:hypothetical protein [Qipengyuania sp. MTN3-11]|uniref:hypothetical protein n=1 Tax=Qipengyuania sp. MTN3-11 TaxID=3056557 RepID=UPI0036F23793